MPDAHNAPMPLDPLTDTVQQMYRAYPFPDQDYRMAYGAQVLRYLRGLKRENGESLIHTADALDAGCGTGNTVLALARQFPEARFVGVDLCEASLNKARQRATAEQIQNVEFIQANLLELDLGRTFDVIVSFGVLHHLTDPTRGLCRIASHLRPHGRLVLWLYGKYGRFRLNLNQRMFDILLRDVKDLSQKVELVRRTLRSGPQDNLQCHFNVADSSIENDWPASRDWVLDKDPWITDQFLHPNERVVNIEDILDMFETAALSLEKWIGVRTDLRQYVDDSRIGDAFASLNDRDQLTVIDLLLKPDYYTVAARRADT